MKKCADCGHSKDEHQGGLGICMWADGRIVGGTNIEESVDGDTCNCRRFRKVKT